MESPVAEIIKSLGFPVSVAIAIGFAFWRVLSWVAQKMVEPMMENLREMTKTNHQISETLREIEENGTSQINLQNSQIKILDHLAERIAKLEVKVEELAKARH